jgi:PKD repeat protein
LDPDVVANWDFLDPMACIYTSVAVVGCKRSASGNKTKTKIEQKTQMRPYQRPYPRNSYAPPKTLRPFALSLVLPFLPLTALSQVTVEASANPTQGTVPVKVQFTSAGTDSNGHAVTNWHWDFGDGTSSALQSPSHTYQTSDDFYPALWATNNLGAAVYGPLPEIQVGLPTVQPSTKPPSGVVPLTIQFGCPSIDSGGNVITNWNWTFGDGFSSTDQNPMHTYTRTGEFRPGLVVTNSLGIGFVALGPAPIYATAVPTPPGLVSNGGFETGTFAGWTLKDSGLPGYDLVDTFYQSTEGMEPHGGSYFARLGQIGSLGYLSQTLATTAGANYVLSFWLNSPDGLTPNIFRVSWDGNTLLSLFNLPAFGWTNFQFVVQATTPATVLKFGFFDRPTALGLDEVSVLPAGPSLIGLTFSAGNVVASGANGVSGQTYSLLSSTNLGLPLSEWPSVATSVLGVSGNFTLSATNAFSPNVSQMFYVIRQQ